MTEEHANDETKRRFEALLEAKKHARAEQPSGGRATGKRPDRPGPGKKEFRRRKV